MCVNTSIYEGLAVSFLEAFACETPVVSCQDPGFTVSRFGIFVGRYDGTGMEGLDAFANAVRRLLCDSETTRKLGMEARQWVNAIHNKDEFLARFSQLCAHAGVPLHLRAASA